MTTAATATSAGARAATADVIALTTYTPPRRLAAWPAQLSATIADDAHGTVFAATMLIDRGQDYAARQEHGDELVDALLWTKAWPC
ncbi:MAG: hypothetical protein LC798_12070 [Chloroflexi bacterium]|nr:hypothetical protein [Chloroflexota bacterium]